MGRYVRIGVNVNFIEEQGEQMPEISIIVPVYKVEKYLDRCVESIRKQTLKNFELILVDDGSPDQCPELCDAWSRRDSRIHVVHKENGGLSSARNAGLEAARGNYIGFVDSDDWVAEDMYELLYGMMIESDADYASVGMCITKTERQNKSQPDPQKRVLLQDELFMDFFRVSDSEIHYCVCDKLFKKEILDNVRFWEGMRFEDIDFIFNVLQNSKKGICSNQVKYFWFYNEDSITRSRLIPEDMQLLTVWNKIVAVCRRKYPEYVYFARMNYERAYMGLLAKSARFGVDDRYDDWKKDKKRLLSHLRKNCFVLLHWRMPVSRKALLLALALNPDLVAIPFRVRKNI